MVMSLSAGDLLRLPTDAARPLPAVEATPLRRGPGRRRRLGPGRGLRSSCRPERMKGVICSHPGWACGGAATGSDHRRSHGGGRAGDRGGRGGRDRRPDRLGGKADVLVVGRECRPAAVSPTTGGLNGVNFADVTGGRIENVISDDNRYGIVVGGGRNNAVVNCTLARLPAWGQLPRARGPGPSTTASPRGRNSRTTSASRPRGSASTTTSTSRSSSARWRARSAARRWVTGRREQPGCPFGPTPGLLP